MVVHVANTVDWDEPIDAEDTHTAGMVDIAEHAVDVEMRHGVAGQNLMAFCCVLHSSCLPVVVMFLVNVVTSSPACEAAQGLAHRPGVENKMLAEVVSGSMD